MLALHPEAIAHIGEFTITNTLINTLLVDVTLIALAVFVTKKATLVPGLFQSVVELVIEGFYNLIKSVAAERTMKIFPYVMTFFLFILIANWSGLLPLITAITFHPHGGEHVHLIRSASTDLNFTLALAIISLVATHTMSITTLGIKSYLNRFFPLNPLGLYTGLLELVSEFTKVISFSFRLFGNIFVGEVMLLTLSTAFAIFAPIPLLMYELLVGIIQASIFALLTMAFMAIFTAPHGSEH
ncbi:MAG: FoF1 ATP synthase subunit a [Patescibacteria group bacterium]